MSRRRSSEPMPSALFPHPADVFNEQQNRGEPGPIRGARPRDKRTPNLSLPAFSDSDPLIFLLFPSRSKIENNLTLNSLKLSPLRLRLRNQQQTDPYSDPDQWTA